ncbi:MAG: hypothetical protein GF401_01420 [Chitinivibrionales bacterium]|nr:hypothetical protein [Chitinivibrionales bacterium]
MYEKPQYLTPGGYKRMSKNPYKKDEQNSQANKKALPSKNLPVQNRRPKRTIDEKTAKLIAEAIKTMMHSK